MKLTDLYQTVTDRIVAELEAGAAPWVKPWKNGPAAGVMPQNAATGRPYSGANILLLWAARDANGWPTAGFMTFQQALAKGGSVRKGERGTHVVFTKSVAADEDDEDRRVRVARTYVVFNAAQIDGLPPAETDRPPPMSPLPTIAEQLISAAGIALRYGGNQAAYIPSRDLIVLPDMGAFRTVEHHEATALHEAVHATGHEQRLARDLKHRFGSEAYAAEELIAELGSAFLCAHFGIEGELRHAGYIQTWIGLLKRDDRAIFTAASQASRAADWLRNRWQLVEDAA